MERDLQLGQLVIATNAKAVSEDSFSSLPLAVVHNLTQGSEEQKDGGQSLSFGIWYLQGELAGKVIKTGRDWMELSEREQRGAIQWKLYDGGASTEPSWAFFLGLRLSKRQVESVFANHLGPDIGAQVVENYTITMKIAPEDVKFAGMRRSLLGKRK